ncbi:MAG: hypothetical protein AAF961_08545, partial [Planctomycetota bacterium]
MRRATAVAALGALASLTTSAMALEITFAVDASRSKLDVNAAAQILVFNFDDDDEQYLGGLIETRFDFEPNSVFAPIGFEVTSARVTHLAPFQLTLGNFLASVDVSVTNAVVDVSTLAPPAPLERTDDEEVVYRFDAAAFEIAIVEGLAEATGDLEDSIDFSEMPAVGSADPETYGFLTFEVTPLDGGDQEIAARLELPIDFIEEVDFQGATVTLDVDGMVVAHSSFLLASADQTADFDGSGVV